MDSTAPRTIRRLGAATLVALALVASALALPDGTLSRTCLLYTSPSPRDRS